MKNPRRETLSSLFSFFAMKEYNKDFYSGQAWKNTRRAYKKSKQGLCENCLRNGVISAGVIVHHKIHITPDNITSPEIALNFDNLELLCRKCHGEAHGAQIKRYKVDYMGVVAPL